MTGVSDVSVIIRWQASTTLSLSLSLCSGTSIEPLSLSLCSRPTIEPLSLSPYHRSSLFLSVSLFPPYHQSSLSLCICVCVRACVRACVCVCVPALASIVHVCAPQDSYGVHVYERTVRPSGRNAIMRDTSSGTALLTG